MTTHLPRDIQNARPYFKQKLRQVVCAPLETLTDDYLREHGWKVEAIFPPVSGPNFDQRPKENTLIVVVKKEPKNANTIS